MWYASYGVYPAFIGWWPFLSPVVGIHSIECSATSCVRQVISLMFVPITLRVLVVFVCAGDYFHCAGLPLPVGPCTFGMWLSIPSRVSGVRSPVSTAGFVCARDSFHCVAMILVGGHTLVCVVPSLLSCLVQIQAQTYPVWTRVSCDAPSFLVLVYFARVLGTFPVCRALSRCISYYFPGWESHVVWAATSVLCLV